MLHLAQRYKNSHFRFCFFFSNLILIIPEGINKTLCRSLRAFKIKVYLKKNLSKRTNICRSYNSMSVWMDLYIYIYIKYFLFNITLVPCSNIGGFRCTCYNSPLGGGLVPFWPSGEAGGSDWLGAGLWADSLIPLSVRWMRERCFRRPFSLWSLSSAEVRGGEVLDKVLRGRE